MIAALARLALEVTIIGGIPAALTVLGVKATRARRAVTGRTRTVPTTSLGPGDVLVWLGGERLTVDGYPWQPEAEAFKASTALYVNVRGRDLPLVINEEIVEVEA